MSMVNFERRKFNVASGEVRRVLEEHAANFLTGFNLAAADWPAVHDLLADVPAAERGFAYEGAGMYAALRDTVSLSGGRSLARLLTGPGAGYVHLVHTGAGWLFAPAHLPLPVPLPGTPLLRWLALDGAGFGETYFGGLPVLRRRVRQRPGARWQVRIAGCGRALWFVLCADPAAIAGEIAAAPATARGWLWSGIGLAAGYAGAVSAAGLDQLALASGVARAQLAQGIVFAAAARARAGPVPAHTELACRQVLSIDPDQAAGWADDAAAGLTTTRAIGAYLTWKERIREMVVAHGE